MYGFSASAQVANNDLPISIPGLQLWLDRSTMLPASGFPVLATSVIDRSSLNRAITIASVEVADGTFKRGTRPSFWITNSGTGNLSFSSITLTGAYSFFVVLQKAGDGLAVNMFSNNSTITYLSINTSSNLVSFDGTTTSTSTGTVSNGNITIAMTGTGAGGPPSFYINGVLDSSPGGLSTSAKTMTAFGNASGPNSSGTFFAEAMYYNRALTAGQILQLHRYAAGRWFDNA